MSKRCNHKYKNGPKVGQQCALTCRSGSYCHVHISQHSKQPNLQNMPKAERFKDLTRAPQSYSDSESESRSEDSESHESVNESNSESEVEQISESSDSDSISESEALAQVINCRCSKHCPRCESAKSKL